MLGPSLFRKIESTPLGDQWLPRLNTVMPPDKSAYLKAKFFITHPKHMFKSMGKKIITFFRKKILVWIYA